MSRQMDSGALTLMSRILQLGAGGEQTTTLDDGHVSQTLDIESIVRRSLTFANSTGLFYLGFENVHVGAGEIASSFDPYSNTTAGVNAFPSTVPLGFDLWFLYAFLRRTAGAGALTGGVIELVLPATMRAKGAVVTANVPVVLWDSIEALTSREYAITEAGATLAQLNLRLPRGVPIGLRTKAAAAATFSCAIVIGAFPAGLGQDGVV
ncbi:MAG TPA: hypothetical protein ENH89_15210 [Aurantimonas coralicida]|uniref:Uncharacterized protein n=1 Tax=Aurantimonas coralicida TaxID=182270 RepID=A0A9C9NHZ4_9HYPH|nr:hypothetical protein [Aurantimonas coralicida]